jgi:hypothetical protein
VSATFAALAIVGFALLAYAWRGWLAALGAGLAMLLHHQFFELAHYLKEDTALLFGLAWTFLFAFRFAQRPTTLLAGALGIAAGCAISGKYLGVAVLLVVAPVLWRAPVPGRSRQIAIFASALLLALLVINLPLVLHPGAFASSFHREMQLVVHGQQQDMTRRVPHTLYLNIFRDNTTPIIWVLVLVFLANRWRERRSLPLVEWLIIAFPFALTLTLSFSPKSNDRYYLPATALFTLFAALGAVDLGEMLRRFPLPGRLVWPTAVLLLGQLLCFPVPADWRTLPPYLTAFATDDNHDLLEFVRTHVPKDAVIVKDNRILLPDPANPRDATRFEPLPQKIIARKYCADAGTIEDLRQAGVTYLAVSESDYGGFLLSGVHSTAGKSADFNRRKAFYEELLRDGTPVFQRERGNVLYLHPGIRLYPLPPPRG